LKTGVVLICAGLLVEKIIIFFKICYQADNRNNLRLFLNFCKISRNPAEISRFCRKEQIPRLGSNFGGSRKTVGFSTIITD